MKKLLFSLGIAALLAESAWAAQAFFTGRMQMVQTVTGQSAWNCEYNYAGHTFWRTFIGSCPYSIDVQ